MGVLQPGPVVEPIELANEPEFDLGGMRVKPAERAVEANGDRRELQPRAMQVLIALAQARPAVVSRDKLIEQCWNGRIVGDDAINRIILSLRHLAQELTPQPFTIDTVPRVGHKLVECRLGPEERPSTSHPIPRSWLAVAAALTLLIAPAIALLFLRPWEARAHEPTVLVTANGSDGASRELAQDLAVKLGSLKAAQSPPMRLIAAPERSSSKPDLVLSVQRISRPGHPAGSVVLTAGPRQSVLWSKEFEQPSRNLADLKQQIAYTTARVVGCALEGMASEEPLREGVLKTYLNACAAMSDVAAFDARPVVRALESVVSSSPGFVGGWAKLLQAESEALASPVVPAGPSAASALKRHILAARRLKTDLPEAHLAEYYLTRPIDFVGRARLLGAAVERSPHHAGVRSLRAFFFASVGATDDAVREAREAVRLDPLSPALRDGYVAALSYAGHSKIALDEVAKAERLWPGASSTIEARYRVHLRFGDPKEALRLIESRAVDMPVAPLHRTFLQARIDPSPANVDKAIRQGRIAYRDYPQSIYNYAQTLAEFDRKDELLRILLDPRDVDALALSTEALFRPAFRELHRDPRIMVVAKRIGLLNYWRTTGKWPDFCFAPDLPYDCKAEAARVSR